MLEWRYSMKIGIAADHAGFALKERLRDRLVRDGHVVVDFGTYSADSVDYPDYAFPVANSVSMGWVDRGILVCSTGVGMSIAANKVQGVRAALGTTADEVSLVRSHNDANVLTLGARYLNEEGAAELVEVFLKTAFEGGRHERRLSKIGDFERDRAHQDSVHGVKAES